MVLQIALVAIVAAILFPWVRRKLTIVGVGLLGALFLFLLVVMLAQEFG